MDIPTPTGDFPAPARRTRISRSCPGQRPSVVGHRGLCFSGAITCRIPRVGNRHKGPSSDSVLHRWIDLFMGRERMGRARRCPALLARLGGWWGSMGPARLCGHPAQPAEGQKPHISEAVTDGWPERRRPNCASLRLPVLYPSLKSRPYSVRQALQMQRRRSPCLGYALSESRVTFQEISARGRDSDLAGAFRQRRASCRCP